MGSSMGRVLRGAGSCLDEEGGQMAGSLLSGWQQRRGKAPVLYDDFIENSEVKHESGMCAPVIIKSPSAEARISTGSRRSAFAWVSEDLR